MHQIEWKDEYLTGVEEIDLQHKQFVNLINRLNIVHDYGDNKGIAVRLLSEFEKYAEYHFTSEENIMYLTKYPAIERQSHAHAALLEDFARHMQNFLNDKGTIEDVIRFLEGWFSRHTIEEDKKIGVHLSNLKKE